jgi:lipoprotein-releasing system permease protein
MPAVLLGSVLARRLRVSPGEALTIVNPIGQESPLGRVPRSEYFAFAGTIESGLYYYDANTCFALLADAQEFFNLGRGVNGLEISVKDIYRAQEVGMDLLKATGYRYYYQDWMSSNHSLLAALKLEKITMFVILTLIVLVAAFGIVSSLIMLVMKKTRDIGILKAMGAGSKSIWRIFVIMGGIIGVIGALAGAALGSLLCWLLGKYRFIELPADIYALQTLPVQLDPELVLLVAGLAVVICLLATLYPAWVASRLDPVAALRYQ